MGKKIYQRILAVILSSVLIIGNGVSVSAQGAVSGNQVGNDVEAEGDLDYTDWSHIYFGAYPQGEVTDEATKTAIDNAISQGNGQPAGTAGSSEGIDVWVGNIKYRRISKEDCNHDYYFDDVDNNGYRYFKWERIKWRVLQNDGNTLFVAADMAVDCKDYNDTYTSITWENCTLRSWLNNSFYQTAFTGAEQGAIVAQSVVNEDNPYYGTEGGNDTKDKVYLLSIEEVTNASYGFCSDYTVYLDSRRLKTSDYANVRGAYRDTDTGYEGNCWWWLRSPGRYSGNAADVYVIGYVDRSGNDVDSNFGGVVPVLHINLSSDLWSMNAEGTGGTGTGMPANPVHHCIIGDSTVTPSNPVHHHTGEDDGTDTTTWSYVYFGSYPQSEVTDTASKSAIDSAIAQVKLVSAGNGVDVWVNGTKYRRISKEGCNTTSYFDNVDNDGYRYFKWERIKWRVLNNNGSTLFVSADMAVDCKDYNDTYTSTTWENCPLRSWLNNSFYQTAFTGAEQGAIVAQNVVNEDNPYNGTEGGNDTTDKVYLLSIGEVTDEALGFCSDYSVESGSRRLKTSDYANARGAYRYTSTTSTAYKGNCWWWLRSPGDYSIDAAYVFCDGYVYSFGNNVDVASVGVVPALHINLSSDLWCMTDDGTSGAGGSISEGITKTDAPKDSLGVYGMADGQTAPKGTVITGSSTASGGNAGVPKDMTFKVTSGATAGQPVTAGEQPTVECTGTTNKTKKTVTIPDYITYNSVKYKVTSVAAKSFKGNKKITTVKIASEITKIGDSAFEGCTNLKTVTVGKGLQTIGKKAFKNCKSLTKLTLKGKNLKKVGGSAFKGINATCKIKVPKKKLADYQKVMKKKGQAATVKITG